jgi:hypothetical protein
VVPVEPDISVVRTIAEPCLPLGMHYAASTFAAGAFNKLYLPSHHNNIHPSFILRVILPVDLYFKTASEVAMFKYLSHHTTIPVPQLVAYNTSADNELGF